MYLIYGLQKSGLSIIKLLNKKNKKYKIWDDNIKIRKNLKFFFKNTIFFNPNRNNLNEFKKIYVSPGISLRKDIFCIKNVTKKLNRDLNLYLSHLKNQKIIAITGTNGKSTTTKLIGDILIKNNIKTFVGGNIGEPLCNSLTSKKNYDFHVIELSSFQLEKISNFNSKISIITNLANDHLDRYKNINDYINQKRKIISENGINIISIDDKYSKKIFLQKEIKNKISFSICDQSANVYMIDNFIFDNYFKKNKKLYINELSKDLEGHFNKQNIIISYICCKLLRLPEKNFLKTIKNFRGLPHRSKVIYKSSKLKIINNSKSTNINSTINSIRNYENIYLIMGGIAKENNFEIISKYKNKIKCIYVYGSSALVIKKKLNNVIKIKQFKNLQLVIKQLFKDLKNNNSFSNILFAPACASFDQYKNFEERGEHFINLIKQNVKEL